MGHGLTGKVLEQEARMLGLTPDELLRRVEGARAEDDEYLSVAREWSSRRKRSENRIDLFVIGFGRPDLLREQHRLVDKFLVDEHGMCVLDNSPEPEQQKEMRRACRDLGLGYIRVPSERHEHPDGLNAAARVADEIRSEYWATLDHDVFPRKRVRMIPKIRKSGFYGIGQRHGPTQSKYLWPGFCFWSREWLAGRVPDYGGIRAVDKRNDGDCGSLLHMLFTEEDWERMHRGEHGYGTIRPEDGVGLQSWGYEVFDGSWVHLTNGSHWMEIPEPAERDELLRAMLAKL